MTEIVYYPFPIRSTPSRVDIHEHRAPTDESIKIYDEMKKRAHDSIIDAFTVQNTLYEAVVAIEKDMLHFKTMIVFKMKINGQLFSDKIELLDFYDGRRTDIVKIVHQAFVHKLSEMLTIESFHIKELRR